MLLSDWVLAECLEMSYFQPLNRNEINEIGDLVELGQDASPTQKTSMFQQLETRISFASLF